MAISFCVATAFGCFESTNTRESIRDDVFVVRVSPTDYLDAPTNIDLGQLGRSRRAQYDVVVQNSGDRVVRIDTIKTSCDCVVFDLKKAEIPAQGERAARLQVDLTSDTDFSGGLAVSVEGFNANNKRVFYALVHFKVPKSKKSIAKTDVK